MLRGHKNVTCSSSCNNEKKYFTSVESDLQLGQMLVRQHSSLRRITDIRQW